MNTDSQSHKEIRYLRFLNNTLQISEIRKDICDEFTRKIFDYVEDEPLFDAQVFCALLYKFIFKCKLHQSLVMTAENNIYDKIRLDAGGIANELSLFLDLWSVNFALSSVDPNQFRNVSIEEKLKHLLENDEPDWRSARVKIIVPEMRGNTGIVPYFDLEFKLPRLSVGQKLDIVHFAICALNYLSQKDEPVYTFSNPEISPAVLVSKPEQLKVVSNNLNQVRYYIISNAINEKESDDDELNALEFDQNEPTTARIINAQSQDPKIEKQWLDENSPVFVKSNTENEEIYLDEKAENFLTKRQWLIAMSFFVDAFKLRSIDKINFSRLLTVMNNGKNYQDFRAKFDARDLITAKTAKDAQKIADLFREFKLPDIADDIENKINKLKM